MSPHSNIQKPVPAPSKQMSEDNIPTRHRLVLSLIDEID
jgi:hypothetical protein